MQKIASFINATLNDCSPLVLLEAMQADITIIASYVEGIIDSIKDGRTPFILKNLIKIQ